MKKLLPWLASLAILVVGFGTVYGAVQQSQRSDANYPQIQMAEDTAAELQHGEFAAAQLAPNIDVAKSLAPFTIIFDKSGKVTQGSGYLNGKVPKAPLGILAAAKGKDYNAVTWQPQKGVRIAAITVAGKDYYVLSGRNLKEVEKNENRTLLLALLGGIVSVILLAFIFVVSGGLTEDF
jgi:hypothetical protein